MKRRIVFLALLFPMLLVTLGPAAQTERPIRISLVALIANPEKFDGKLVAVSGYLRLEEEGNILYLTETDYWNGQKKNGIWVERTKQMERDIDKLASNYVVLVGVFDAKDLGHMGANSGSIVRIRNCTFWSDPKYPIVRRLQDERKNPPR